MNANLVTIGMLKKAIYFEKMCDCNLVPSEIFITCMVFQMTDVLRITDMSLLHARKP